MSYLEYLDLFKKAQNKDCKYIAYFLDIKNSKTEIKNSTDLIKHFMFINSLTDKLSPYLKQDEFNVLNNLITKSKNIDANNNNPISIGDGVCYFFDKDKISTDKFKQIVVDCMKENSYKFDLHLNFAKYETNDIKEANSKLYKGYMLRILEELKSNSQIISINTELEK